MCFDESLSESADSMSGSKLLRKALLAPYYSTKSTGVVLCRAFLLLLCFE